MTPDEYTAGKYSWTGTLYAGEIKFLTTIGSWDPGITLNYNENQTLVLNQSYDLISSVNGLHDYHLVIDAQANYRIDVDMNNLSMIITTPPTTTILDNAKENEIKYNIHDGELNLFNLKANSIVDILDLTGRSIAHTLNKTQIPIMNLHGVYLIRVTYDNQISFRTKICL